MPVFYVKELDGYIEAPEGVSMEQLTADLDAIGSDLQRRAEQGRELRGELDQVRQDADVTAGEVAKETLRGVGRGLLQLPASALESAALWGAKVTERPDVEKIPGRRHARGQYRVVPKGPGQTAGERAEATTAYQLGQHLRELLPPDETVQASTTGIVGPMLGEAAGQMAGFIAGGAAAKAARLPMAAGAAGTGAVMGGAAAYREAKAAGANDEGAWKAYLINSGMGLSEAMPIAGMFSKLNRATGGGLRRKLVDSSVTGIEEAAQEVLQTIGSNATARKIYDEHRPLLEGVQESGGIGYLIGKGAHLALGASGGQPPDGPARAIEQVRELNRRADDGDLPVTDEEYQKALAKVAEQARKLQETIDRVGDPPAETATQPEPVAPPAAEPAPPAPASAPPVESGMFPALRWDAERQQMIDESTGEPVPEAEPGVNVPNRVAPAEVAEQAPEAPVPPMPAPQAEPVETTTTIDESWSRPVFLDPDKLQLSEDVPNFKRGASSETGEVPGNEIRGDLDKKMAPIVVWERLDGRMEVITGRHRFAAAKRRKLPSIPAHVEREADGFDINKALTLDAEWNIRDGAGTLFDYATYFRNSPQYTRAQAEQRGLLSNAKGQAGFDLGRDASDDLFALYSAGKVNEAQALAIVRAAPQNPSAQQVGAKYALAGKSADFISNLVKAAMAQSGGRAETLDLFGQDDAAMRQMEEQAERAARIQKEIKDQINAVKGAAKRPEVAAKLGVNVQDPQGVQRRVAELAAELDRWQSWPMHPDLVAQTRAKEPTSTADQPFSLDAPESVEQQAARMASEKERRQAAKRRDDASDAAAAPLTGTSGDLGQGDLLQRPDDLFATPPPKPAKVEPDSAERYAKLLEAAKPYIETGPQYDRTVVEYYQLLQSRMANPSSQAAAMAAERLGQALQRLLPKPGGGGGSGYASVGTYNTGAPVLLGGMEHIHPAEMPEIVRMAHDLMGRVIGLRRMPRARGIFNPVDGGAIKLNPEIFKNPLQAARVLAHEIGHLWDYLPDRTMARGNLFGRLGTLKRFLMTTFPRSPWDDLDVILSKKDRRKIRYQAEREAGPRPPKDEEYYLMMWRLRVSEIYHRLIDEAIEERNLVKHKDLFDELFSLSDYWRPIGENVTEGYLKYRKSSAELYADAISVLLNSPGLLQQRAPIFWELFFGRLDRKPEVREAFFGLQQLLNQGAEAVFDRRLQQQRNQSQSAEEQLIEVIEDRRRRRFTLQGFTKGVKQELVDKGEALNEAMREMQRRGIKVRPTDNPRYAWEHQFFGDNRMMLDMREIYDGVVRPVEAAGLDTVTLGQVLELQRMAGNITVYRELQRLRSAVADNPELATPEQNAYMERLAQIAGSRADLANPGGHNPETAQATLDYLLGTMPPPQRAAVLQAAAKLRSIVWDRVTEAAKKGIYSQEFYTTTARFNKDFYAAFRGAEHVDDWVTPMIRQGRGTLGAIENPFLTTIIKLAALNNLIVKHDAKVAGRNFFTQHFPETWKKAPTRWVEGVQRPERPPDGYERVDVLENGRPVAYHVDAYVAKAYEQADPGTINWTLRTLDWPFRQIIYPFIVKYNPAFHLWSNYNRDYQRSARNIGAAAGVNRWRYVRNWMKSFGSARKYVLGQPDELGREMLANFVIGTPLDSMLMLDRQNDAFADLMRRYRLMPEKETSKLKSALMWLPKKLEHIGLVLEYAPKFAGYRSIMEAKTKHLAGTGAQVFMSEGDRLEASNVVRNYVGTPNFRVKGTKTEYTNTLLPFSNIFVQGYRADYKVATNPKTAGGWWFRWAMHNGSKALLMGLAAAGVFGEAIRRLLEGASEYDKSNYVVIPVGEQKGGEFGSKTVYLRIPIDESGRFLHAITYKLAKMAGDLAMGNKPDAGLPTEIFDVGAGIVPTVSPIIQIAGAWKDYLTGNNPIDPFRKRNVVPRSDFEAGGWHATKHMLTWTVDKTGVLNFFRYDPNSKTTTEAVIKGMPVVNRAIKVSDYGLAEKQRQAEDEETSLKRQMQMGYSGEVRALNAEMYRLQGIGARRTPQQEERYLMLRQWRRTYQFYDGAAWDAEQNGDKSEAKEIVKSVNAEAKRFMEEFPRP